MVKVEQGPSAWQDDRGGVEAEDPVEYSLRGSRPGPPSGRNVGHRSDAGAESVYLR